MAVSSTVILFSLPPHRDLLPPLSFLLHQVDKLVLPRDEHLRIAIVIFIVPFVVNVSTPVSLSALSCCQIRQSIQLIMNMHSPLLLPSPSYTGGDVLDSRQYSDAQETQADHSCSLP